MEKKDFLFDVRLLNNHLQRGVISQKDYEKFLKELPDMEGEYEEDPSSSVKRSPLPEQETP